MFNSGVCEAKFISGNCSKDLSVSISTEAQISSLVTLSVPYSRTHVQRPALDDGERDSRAGALIETLLPRLCKPKLPSGYNSSKCQWVPEIPLIFHSCHIIITFCLEAYTWHFQCLKIAYKRLEKAFHQVMEHQDEWKWFLAERGQN